AAGRGGRRERVAVRLGGRFGSVRMLLPYDRGARRAELYALGAPIQERVDQPDGVFVRAHLPRRELPRFAPYLLAEAREQPARSAKSSSWRSSDSARTRSSPHAPTPATSGSTS